MDATTAQHLAPPQSHSRDLWQAAFGRLSPTDVKKLDPTRTGVRNILAAQRIANEKYQMSKDKRWKIRKSGGNEIVIRDVFEKIVHWIDRFKAVGDNASQFDPVHAALPWAAFRFLLQAAVNESTVYADTVEDLELVARAVARLREVEQLYRCRESPLLDQIEGALVKTYAAILELLASVVHFSKDSTTSRLAKAPFRLVSHEKRDAIAAQEAEVYSIARLMDSSLLSRIEAQISRLADAKLSSLKAVEQQTYAAVLRRLSSVPIGRIHDSVSKSRIPDTGRWLLETEQFRSWMAHSSSSLLLLSGIPGSGKTVICSAVIDKHLQDVESVPGVAPVALFYCSASECERDRRSPEGALRSLARQLTVFKTPNLAVHSAVSTTFANLAHEAELDGFSLPGPDVEMCVGFILAALEENPATIIIDALDELDEPSVLVKAVNTILDKSRNVVKILMSSRDDPKMVRMLSPSSQIRITPEQTAPDMRLFTAHSVDEAILSHKLLSGTATQSVRDRIVDAFATQAQDMFRWIELQLVRLCSLSLEADVLYALTNSSHLTLNDLYTDTYRRISTGGKSAEELAMRTFTWLLYMREPLTSPAFLSALAATANSSHAAVDQILVTCHGFVYFDRQLDLIRFAHHSAREFLQLQPAFAPATAHSVLALDCLSACSDPPFDMTTQLQPSERFYDYAALYFGDHCSAAQKSALFDKVYPKLVEFMFDGDQPALSFTMWMDCVKTAYDSLPREHQQKSKMQMVSSESSLPLFSSCTFGLSCVLEHHECQVGVDWNERNSYGHRPLYAAAYFGYASVASFLLQKGADPNLECGRLGSPLHCAAFRGHDQVVQVLIDHQAGTKGNNKFESALHAASRGGHENIALMLLDLEFDNLLQSDFDSYQEALLEAGFIHAVDRLRDHPLSGARRSTRIIETGTKAIMSGKVASLRYCLRNTALSDLVPAGSVALGALHGQGPTVSFLLDQGLDIEETGDLGSPLRCASLAGHSDVCRLLLNRGAEINANGRFGSALHAAAMKGNLHTLKLLLGSGADPNIRGGYHGTCIQAAAYHGHNEVLEQLLAAGSDPHMAGFSKDAFHAAAEGDRQDTISLLLASGFRPSMPISRSLARRPRPRPRPRNILRETSPATIRRRNIGIRSTVGANEDTKQGFHRHPEDLNINYVLDAAAELGNAQTVLYILANTKRLCIDQNEIDRALSTACKSGRCDIVDIFLNHGNKSDIPFQKVLLDACRSGHEGIVKTIMKWGQGKEIPSRETFTASCQSGRGNVVQAIMSHINRDVLSIQEAFLMAILEDHTSSASFPENTALLNTGPGDVKVSPISSNAIATSPFHVTLEVAKRELSMREIAHDLRDCCAAAVETNRSDVMKIILEWNPDIEPAKLLDLCMTACQNGKFRVAEILYKAVQEDSEIALQMIQFVIKADQQHDPNVVRQMWPLLVRHATQNDWQLLFMVSAAHGMIENVRLLLDHVVGDTVNNDLLIERALSIAAFNGHFILCTFFLDKGALPTRPVSLLLWDDLSLVYKHYSSFQDALRRLDRHRRNFLQEPTACNAIESCLVGYKRLHTSSDVSYTLRRRERWQGDRQEEEIWSNQNKTMKILLGSLPSSASLTWTDIFCKAILVYPVEIVSLMINRTADLSSQISREQIVDMIRACEISPGPILQKFLHDGRLRGLLEARSFLRDCLKAGLQHFHLYKGPPEEHGPLFTQVPAMRNVFTTGPGAVVEDLLSLLPDEQAQGSQYNVLLQCAAASGQDSLVVTLIQRGIDVNATGSYYGTAIQAASRFGHATIVKSLVGGGADPNIARGRHHTALRAAVAGGYLGIVEDLIKAGADITMEMSREENLLQLATQQEDSRIALALISAGADPYAHTSHSYSPLWEACRKEDNSIVSAILRALKESARLQNHQKDVEHAMYVTIRRDATETLDIFLSSGLCTSFSAMNRALTEAMEFSEKGYALASLLELAVQNEQLNRAFEAVSGHLFRAKPAALKVLLEYFPYDSNIFVAASALDYEEVVRIGLQRCLKVDTVDEKGRPALHAAAVSASVSTLSLLLENGADPNGVDSTYGLPLRATLEAYALDQLQRLRYRCNRLQLTKFPEQVDKHVSLLDELRPWGRYWTSNNVRIVRGQNDSKNDREDRAVNYQRTISLLMVYGARAESSAGVFGNDLMLAAFIGSRPIFGHLLQIGANISAKGGFLHSCLLAAAKGDHLDMIEEIVSFNLDSLSAALVIVCQNGNLKAVQILLGHLTGPVAEEDDGITPLLSALEFLVTRDMFHDQPDDGFRIVNLLLDPKFRPSISSKELVAAAKIYRRDIREDILNKLIPLAGTRYFPEDGFIALLEHSRNIYGADGATMIKTLLNDGRICKITAQMLQSVDNVEDLRALIDHGTLHDVSAETLDIISKRKGKNRRECIEILIRRYNSIAPYESTITALLDQEYIAFSFREAHYNSDVIGLLLSRNRNLTVTESMLLAAQQPADLKILLSRMKPEQALITPALLDAIAKSTKENPGRHSEKILRMLIDSRPSVNVPPISASIYINEGGVNALKHLWKMRSTIEVSEEEFSRLSQFWPSARKSYEALVKKHGEEWTYSEELLADFMNSYRLRYGLEIEDEDEDKDEDEE